MHEVCSFSADWRHETFFKLAHANGDLLDVGCGNGMFIQLAQEKSFRVSGVDFNPKNIDEAKKKGLRDAQVGDIHEFLTSHPQRYDVVTAFDVLEHLPEPQVFLRNVYSALKNDGRVALTFPNSARPMPKPYLRESFDYPPCHFTRWNKKAISIALKKAGFDILEVRTSPLSHGFYSVLIYYKFIESLFPALKKLLLGANSTQTSETWTQLLAADPVAPSPRFFRLRRLLQSPENRQRLVDMGRWTLTVLLSPIEIPLVYWNRRYADRGRTLFVLAKKVDATA
jgi:SAM-dependent methyltransferase